MSEKLCARGRRQAKMIDKLSNWLIIYKSDIEICLVVVIDLREIWFRYKISSKYVENAE